MIFKGDRKAARFLTRFGNVIEKGAGQQNTSQQYERPVRTGSQVGCVSP